MKVKVCGLSNQNEVEISVQYGADFCGFILNYEKSHRNISFSQAKKLTSIDKKRCNYVGVLVNPVQEELKKFSELNFDYFQLYGNFNVESLLNIRKNLKKKIITCIPVKEKKDILKYKKLENSSDIILWDSSGYEKSLSWDYSWIKSISVECEKMVAGNITIDKLEYISKLAEIVDVSGALETNKVKDTDKIIKFLKEVKKINDKDKK